jgi:Tol biopolymer transport system component
VVIAYPDGTIDAEIPATGWSWSPDSMRLAVWGHFRQTVDVYGVDGVRQASLPSPLSGGVTENAPEWMPDGSALLVVGGTPPSEIVVPIDGSPAYEFAGWRPDGLSAASPDGTRVVVLGDRIGFSHSGFSAVVTDADGAPVSEVDVPLRSVPVWSPDGDRFASTNRWGDLVLVDAASGKVTVLTKAKATLSEGEYVNAVRGFSPRGDRILYAALVHDGGASYNDLYSIGVDGSHPRLLVVGAMRGQWRPR